MIEGLTNVAGVIGVVLVLIKTNQTERQQIFTARKTTINWHILFVFQLGAELFGTIVETGLKTLGFLVLAEMQNASRTGIRSVSMMVYGIVLALGLEFNIDKKMRL